MHKNSFILNIAICIGSLCSLPLHAQEHFHQIDSLAIVKNIEATQRHNAVTSIKEEGGEITTHIIDRGENLESIARDYGADPFLLLMLNSGNTDFLAGEEIMIPIFKQQDAAKTENGDMDTMIRSHNIPIYQSAFHNLENGDCKEAIKIFNKLIKEDQSVTAYYGRACAFSKLKKHRQATRDLKYVVLNDRKNLFPEAQELYDYESAIWEQQKQERGQLWGQIVGTVLMTGAQVGNAYLQSKYGSSAPTWNYPTFNSYSGSSYPMNTSYVGSTGSWSAVSPAGTVVEIPAALDYTRYLNSASFQPQFTTDANGNMMVSYPDLASSMVQMNNDLNNYMNSTGYLSSGSASANAIRGMMNLNSQSTMMQATMWNTPMYPEAYENMYNSGDSGYSGNDGNNPGTTQKSNNSSGSSHNCAYCDGTGRIAVTENAPATFGLEKETVKCKECGFTYNKGTFLHYHKTCTHCN